MVQALDPAEYFIVTFALFCNGEVDSDFYPLPDTCR